MAMANEPELLIADEPRGLDVTVQRKIIKLLRRFAARAIRMAWCYQPRPAASSPARREGSPVCSCRRIVRARGGRGHLSIALAIPIARLLAFAAEDRWPGPRALDGDRRIAAVRWPRDRPLRLSSALAAIAIRTRSHHVSRLLRDVSAGSGPSPAIGPSTFDSRVGAMRRTDTRRPERPHCMSGSLRASKARADLSGAIWLEGFPDPRRSMFVLDRTSGHVARLFPMCLRSSQGRGHSGWSASPLREFHARPLCLLAYIEPPRARSSFAATTSRRLSAGKVSSAKAASADRLFPGS